MNDKLCKLLFFAATCREHGASRATAVVPYLAYSRKDRQTKSPDPVTTRYIAQLFEAVGIDMVVTLGVHNLAAFQNASAAQRFTWTLGKSIARSLRTSPAPNDR